MSNKQEKLNQLLLKENDFVKILKKNNVTAKEVEKYLLSNILNLDELLPSGYNCLHYAIKSESPDIVNILLTDHDNGTLRANPNIETKDIKKDVYLSPLQFAIQEVCDPSALNKIVKLLIKAEASIFKTDEMQRNVFHLVAEKGNIELVNFILDKDPSILNSISKYGSVLHLAVSGDFTDLVEELLKATDIDLKLLDYQGNSALLLSVVMKNFNCFKLIFDFIKDHTIMPMEAKKLLFNQKNSDGNCLLHELALAKSNILLQMVLKLDSEIGIDCNEKNNNNHTYKEIQDDIVKMVKEKEELEKQRRENLRKEKQRLFEEQRKKDEEIRIEKEKEKLKDEKAKAIQEGLIKHRGKIFLGFLIAFLIILYFIILNSLSNRKKTVII